MGIKYLALATAIMGASIMNSPSATAGTIDDVKQRGTVTVGVGVFVPWALLTSKGEVVGYEPDVWRRIAHDLGVDIKFQMPPWDSMVASFLERKVDFISGMLATPERAKVVDFSQPFMTTGIQVLIQKGSRLTLEEMDSPNVTLVARRGSSAATMVPQRWPRAAFRTFDDDTWAVQEVLSGRSDAMVAAEPLPALSAMIHPELRVIPDVLDQQDETIPVLKGDSGTLAWLNAWIAARVADGWLAERQAYWFRSTEWMGK